MSDDHDGDLVDPAGESWIRLGPATRAEDIPHIDHHVLEPGADARGELLGHTHIFPAGFSRLVQSGMLVRWWGGRARIAFVERDCLPIVCVVDPATARGLARSIRRARTSTRPVDPPGHGLRGLPWRGLRAVRIGADEADADPAVLIQCRVATGVYATIPLPGDAAESLAALLDRD